MRRFFLLGATIIFAFLAIWARLFYWQIISHAKFKTLADNQHFYQLELPPIRGEILSADGTPLVANQTAYLIFAEKKKIEDEEEFIEDIAPILGEEEASISAILNASPVWVPIKHEVEEETAQKLRDLQLAGLGMVREDKRFYPEASMAAHILGFVGKNSEGQGQGYFGLEGFYDKELRGQSGYLRQERDAVGNPIIIGEAERFEPKNGRSLVLYIDKTVQFLVEERLKKGLERYGAKAGVVIVMDPKTGGILASASYPSYDPGLYAEFPSEYYRNPVVADSYEPGSTFKPLIMAAAVNENKIKPTETFDEQGPVRVNEYSIKTWDNKYHGMVSMTQILEYSSNVGMVHIANKLGNDSELAFLKAIEFGQKTGVDLQDEASPLLRDDNEWREIDFATASFGQGIAVTPLQMVRAAGALANDGWLMKPQVVKQIVGFDGERIDITPQQVRQIVSSPTSKIISEMMVSSVEHGEAKWKVPKGFRIAGKTGTAQIPVEGHYDAEKTIASFVGFGPVDNAKFVMLVTLREPTSSPWGSETAAPLFFEIATDLLKYYGLTPQ